jgi:hypothetical protein
MSETLTTTTIEDINVQRREPAISLADVLSAVGTLAYQGTRLTVKGAVIGTRLAAAGIRAGASAVKARRLKSREIDSVVHSAASAQDALIRLSATPGFELPAESAGVMKARLTKLAANNDKAGVLTLAHEIQASSQESLRATVMELATNACRKIGFEAVSLHPQHGLLTARSGVGPGSLSIEVAKSSDGGVQLHVDADGFHGGSCVVKVDALLAELTAQGVQFSLSKRSRNDQSPAFDGNRISMVNQRRYSQGR